ncbi:MAG: AMIN domain-containing protein [Trichodesmium sp. MAG_R04]|nr:AMIN domain-containing protein [Trichodesmium sp. MAG_R04]
MVSQHPKNLSKLKSRLQLITLVGTLTINFSFPVPVWAAFLTNWFFDPDNHQLQFTLPVGAIPTYSVESKPTRLVIYIPDTKVSVDVTELYPTGLVRRVNLSQEGSQQAKVIIDFAPEIVMSAKKVKLEQVAPEDNSWQLRLLMSEEEISTLTEAIVLDGDSVTPTTTLTETTELENSESTKPEDNQSSTSPKQEKVGFLETPPKAISSLASPPPLAVPSIPFLVIPTDKPGNVRFPLIDALGNKKSPTTPSDIGELPPLQVKQTEDNFVPPPPEPEPVEEQNYSTTESVDIISFGETLPRTSGDNQSQDDGSILIEKGEVINLIYPTVEFPLPQGIEIQEVLLLQEAIADQSGKIIVPAKTPVLGGFNTNSNGSQFIARAIYLNGRFIPFAAQSELIRGHRDFDERVLAGSSTGGGLALLLLTSSGFGFLAGAALGASSILFTSPRSVTIEPEGIVEVRVVEDLARSKFYDTSNF